MPNKNKMPVITGIKDAKQLAAFQKMLQATGVPDGVTQIIVGNPIQFEQARKTFGVADSHPAFSVYNMGRVYIPDEVLGNPNLTSKYLLHEFGHYETGAYSRNGSQQNLNDSQREAMEKEAERGALPYRARFEMYRKAPAEPVQTTPAPVAQSLTPPVQQTPPQARLASMMKGLIAAGNN